MIQINKIIFFRKLFINMCSYLNLKLIIYKKLNKYKLNIILNTIGALVWLRVH